MYKSTNQILKDAFNQGIVDPFLNPYVDKDLISSLDYIESNAKTDDAVPDQQCIDQTARAQKYLQNTLGVIDTVDGEANLIELARVSVPDQNIGILRNIEQILQDKDGLIFPTSDDVDGVLYGSIFDIDSSKWLLCIESFDGIVREPVHISNTINFDPWHFLNGFSTPFELPEIHLLKYKVGSNNKTRIIIPPRSTLRLFFYSNISQVYRWKVAGNLEATFQASYHKESVFNVSIGGW